jgi:hypothetical protein
LYFSGNWEKPYTAEGCPEKEPEVEENTRNEAHQSKQINTPF